MNTLPEPFHVLVAGLAKTGTTILYHRVRAGLPPGAGGHFEPWSPELLREVLAVPGASVTKLLLGGSHWGNLAEHQRFHRRLLLVRDPRDHLVSTLLYYFYRFQVDQDLAGFVAARELLARKAADPTCMGTYDLLVEVSALCPVPGDQAPPGADPGQGARMRRHYRRILEYAQVVRPHVVRYEAMVEGQVAALEQYLGVSVSPEVEVDPQFQRVVRSRGAGDWRRWFTAADVDFIHDIAGEFMDRFGYAREAAQDLREPIPAQGTLEYVEQFRPGGAVVERLVQPEP